MTRVLAVALNFGLLTGCVSTTTRLAPVAPEAVEAEEALQRELVIVELNAAQQRLDDLAFGLLAAATPLCPDRVVPRIGVSFATVQAYEDEWALAASEGMGLTDTVTVTSVATGSPAERAGLRLGDRVLAVDGTDVPTGVDAVTALSDLLSRAFPDSVRLEIRRDGEVVEARLAPAEVCDFSPVVIVEGDINAFADGSRVVFPWAMMRFAEDDELLGVLGHEIAHNAMGHIEARRSNALLGGILGAVFDVALATQGVNTYGENTANFMAAAARAFSQDFEREADYVGLYILARAGVSLAAVPDFWRQFAQINPTAISYASTHPTTAERFVRLRQTIDEIEAKQAAGQDLMPEPAR